MGPIDPISHALGSLQTAVEEMRAQQQREMAAANERHDKVMAALDGLRTRVTAVEGTVNAHKVQLEEAENLVETVDRLKAKGTGALIVIAVLWGAAVGAATWFKTEILRWITS